MVKKVSKFNNYLIGVLLGLLGFSTSCSNNGPEVMYGSPHAKHQISGKVTSETNEPIAGIAIKVYSDMLDPLNQLIEVPKVITNASGEYSWNKNQAFPEMKYKVSIEDVDGANNGSYENRIELVDIKRSDLSEGDKSWYSGSASKILNVQLKKK